jgi:hypothetical protein
MEVNSAFLEQRALALATILLTRHSGLIVTAPSFDSGFDLLVRIADSERPTAKMFAVELKARRSSKEVGTKAGSEHIRLKIALRNALSKHANRLRDLPFPLLYIVFAMDKDDAYFGWIREPALEPTRIDVADISLAQKWTKETHLHIASKVNAWYESRRGQA